MYKQISKTPQQIVLNQENGRCKKAPSRRIIKLREGAFVCQDKTVIRTSKNMKEKYSNCWQEETSNEKLPTFWVSGQVCSKAVWFSTKLLRSFSYFCLGILIVNTSSESVSCFFISASMPPCFIISRPCISVFRKTRTSFKMNFRLGRS